MITKAEFEKHKKEFEDIELLYKYSQYTWQELNEKRQFYSQAFIKSGYQSMIGLKSIHRLELLNKIRNWRLQNAN